MRQLSLVLLLIMIGLATMHATAAAQVTATSVQLSWTTPGDDSLTGTASLNDIRYSTSPITSANWAAATQVTGEPAPTAPATAQSHTMSGLTRQTTYYFAIRVSDDGGNLSALSNVPSATTPDLTRPAAITDLAVGFVWLGGPAGEAPPGLAIALPRRRR